MTDQCRHIRTGLVTSRPLGGIEGQYAAAPVCSLPECIAWATKWVERMSRRAAYYVPDSGAR